MASATLAERVAAYSVERRPDGDYTEVEFTCPKHGRRYLSVKPPIAYTTAIAATCYWCDVYGKRRGQDSTFDAAAPQTHLYPLAGPTPASSPEDCRGHVRR
jgi:hypothetical protein